MREAPVAQPPHDPPRLGLPVGISTRAAPRGNAGAPSGALLAAAAILLAGAGLGGLVVGAVGRRLARPA